MILFLDFDGVLHPACVYMGPQGPQLSGEGSLFMWSDFLSEVVADFPNVRIVLSTGWAKRLPFEQVRDSLPLSLSGRVIGSTWHAIHHDSEFSRNLPFSYWQDATRYQQVLRWVKVHRVRRWAAIDDDDSGWADADRDRLIHTEGEIGLSDTFVVGRLRTLLN